MWLKSGGFGTHSSRYIRLLVSPCKILARWDHLILPMDRRCSYMPQSASTTGPQTVLLLKFILAWSPADTPEYSSETCYQGLCIDSHCRTPFEICAPPRRPSQSGWISDIIKGSGTWAVKRFLHPLRSVHSVVMFKRQLKTCAFTQPFYFYDLEQAMFTIYQVLCA